MATSVLKTLFIVIDRAKKDKLTASLATCGVNYQHEVFAKGTAKTGFLEVIGIGETDKELVIGTIKAEQVDIVRHLLETEFNFNEPGNGIAFTVPISAVGGQASLYILAGSPVQVKRRRKNEQL